MTKSKTRADEEKAAVHDLAQSVVDSEAREKAREATKANLAGGEEKPAVEPDSFRIADAHVELNFKDSAVRDRTELAGRLLASLLAHEPRPLIDGVVSRLTENAVAIARDLERAVAESFEEEAEDAAHEMICEETSLEHAAIVEAEGGGADAGS